MAFNSALVVGYTTQDHLLVDLDKVSYHRAKCICTMIQKDFADVGVCLVVRSSELHYHLVFDNKLTWDRIVHIIKILADLGLVQKAYAEVRTFRRDLTLRISEKIGVDRYRTPPEPCIFMVKYNNFKIDYGIKKYLHYLTMFNYNTKNWL